MDAISAQQCGIQATSLTDCQPALPEHSQGRGRRLCRVMAPLLRRLGRAVDRLNCRRVRQVCRAGSMRLRGRKRRRRRDRLCLRISREMRADNVLWHSVAPALCKNSTPASQWHCSPLACSAQPSSWFPRWRCLLSCCCSFMKRSFEEKGERMGGE